MVFCFGNRQSRVFGEDSDHSFGKADRGVDSRSCGRPAQRHFGDPGQSGAHPLNPQANLPGIAAEFLSEGDGSGVHQVSSTRFHHVRPLTRFGLECDGQVVQGGEQVVGKRSGHGDVHGGGEDVVGGLGGVDVVIGVHLATQ